MGHFLIFYFYVETKEKMVVFLRLSGLIKLNKLTLQFRRTNEAPMCENSRLDVEHAFLLVSKKKKKKKNS